MIRGLFKFFSSVKLAVISILLLSAVLGFATVIGSYYGMRGSQVLVYQRWWFGGVLFLLGLNVFCAALSRFPWKLRQAGFVVTHLGIIVILVGAFVTQQFGLDGNMPVSEKKQSSEIILNDLKLVMRDQKTGKSETFSVPESHRSREGKLLKVELGNGEELILEKFIPRAIPESKMIPSPLQGVGLPALKVGLTNSRFQIEEWLRLDPKNAKTELNLGPAVVTFEKLSNKDEERRFYRQKPEEVSAKKPADKGTLLVERKGKKFALKISDLIGKWRTIQDINLEVKVERYLPYAVVEGKKLVSKNSDPVNPAVEVVIRDTEKSEVVEKHTVFALFPEFSTRHGGKNASKEPLDVILGMQKAQLPAELMGVGKSRGRLYLAQTADNSKILYRVLASSGNVNSQGEIQPGQKVATGWMDIELELKEWLPSAVFDEEPRSVEVLQGADEPYLTAIKLKVGKTPSFWLLEGMAKSLAIGSMDLLIQYNRDRMQLPFSLYLDKFTMGTNPGTNTAASFVSDVIVKDPKANTDKNAVISMNEPLKYGGYYFYQASYQLSPGQPAVSVFAVNHDPGRFLKYLGSLVMVFGIGLMFYMNPHYLKILMGSQREST
ncbi:MAG: cytochrome c biogenesis protein ResB [Pseudomonadota bacterium]